MVQEPLTLYKLIILYMLDRVNVPLTNSRISDFILKNEYTDYLTLQAACSQLSESGLITSDKVRNKTLLSLTEEGATTLRYFQSRISESIKQDIKNYLASEELEIKNDISILSDYNKTADGEYEAHLWAKDKNTELIRITLSVPTEELASSVCGKWQDKCQNIYQHITEELF